LSRSGCGFGDGGGYTYGATLGDDDAIGACTLGSADDRAQIVRILDAVQHEQEVVKAAFLFEEISKVGVAFFPGDRNNTLMICRSRQTGELIARHGPNGNALGPAQCNQLLDALIAPS